MTARKNTATARLEARIPVQVYDMMLRAAELRGMTLTGFVMATAGEDAKRVVEEAEILRMARADQVRFAQALIDPPEPSDRLRRAAKRHAALIHPR
ncbi:type II toxin-antitoxin system TacA family antitoxin [Methylobacterium sp. JK268]